ncbi:MAG: hypothetical protein KGI73_00380 [Patescibacteria group bacterium]|nr:hypothetical protein [Patescibacteria group bacterium]
MTFDGAVLDKQARRPRTLTDGGPVQFRVAAADAGDAEGHDAISAGITGDLQQLANHMDARAQEVKGKGDIAAALAAAYDKAASAFRKLARALYKNARAFKDIAKAIRDVIPLMEKARQLIRGAHGDANALIKSLDEMATQAQSLSGTKA